MGLLLVSCGIVAFAQSGNSQTAAGGNAQRPRADPFERVL